MTTQNQLIKSIIFRPELMPFDKDEDNSLNFLDNAGDFELEDEPGVESEEENSSVFITVESEAVVGRSPETLSMAESLQILRNTRISIAA